MTAVNGCGAAVTGEAEGSRRRASGIGIRESGFSGPLRGSDREDSEDVLSVMC